MSAIAVHTFKSRGARWAPALAALAGGAALAVAHERLQRNGGNRNSAPKNSTVLKGFMGGAAVNMAVPPEGKTYQDYQEVYNAIAKKVWDQDDADQGAGRFGLLTRLAWHAAGSFEKKGGTGGTYGGTMIYDPEATDAGNNGLEAGRDFLAEFLEMYPWMSRGDMWTLGGVVAVQEAGGPKIKWRPGRQNVTDRSKVPPNGRLPDATQGAGHVRDVFSRMGFNDVETVALIGAHCLGRCHTWRSGFDGPWGPSPNVFSNDFFVRLLQNWHVRKWDGVKQYEDDETNSYMMLPTDIALKEDLTFLKTVKKYAADQDVFFADFSKAFTKLLENGVKFPRGQKHMEFQTLDEQED